MDELLRRVFFTEIRIQSRLALQSFTKVEELAAERFHGDAPRQLERGFPLWREIHTFLATSAVVSKILWPGRNAPRKSRRRGSELRALLGLSDDSPLSERFVRDALEHIDQRIEEWVPAHVGGPMAGWTITGTGETGLSGAPSLREFNQDSFDLTVAGATCNLRNLAAAVTHASARIKLLVRPTGSYIGEADFIV